MVDSSKHPWVAGNLRIVRSILDRVFEEATDAYGRDEESCGLLTGPASEEAWALLDGIAPMVNRANKLHALDPVTYPRTGRMYFDIDPMKFQRAMAEGDAAARPVKVLYHSHLDVGAYFSATDAAVATIGGESLAYPLAFLVTSVRAGIVDDHKLFVWDESSRGFAPSPLLVDEAR